MEVLRSQDILCVGGDTGDFNLFSIETGDMISNWNFSSAAITQITFMTYEQKLLILDSLGKIMVYDHDTESSLELR